MNLSNMAKTVLGSGILSAFDWLQRGLFFKFFQGRLYMTQLVPGISATSRSQAYARRALFKKKKAPAAKKAAPKPFVVGDVATPKVTRKTPGKVTLRASITPGTVLILLSGRFRGKRVVFLKQLESGLLLVTGPHKVNGVPLRRVNQAYVIATSTKLDISKVKVDAKINDAYFKVAKEVKQKATAEALLGEAKPKTVDASRVADQKAVDSQLLPLIKKTPALKAYLNASFALSKGQYPHVIKF